MVDFPEGLVERKRQHGERRFFKKINHTIGSIHSVHELNSHKRSEDVTIHPSWERRVVHPA